MMRTVMTMILTKVMTRTSISGNSSCRSGTCQSSICEELLIHNGGWKYEKIEPLETVC